MALFERPFTSKDSMRALFLSSSVFMRAVYAFCLAHVLKIGLCVAPFECFFELQKTICTPFLNPCFFMRTFCAHFFRARSENRAFLADL